MAKKKQRKRRIRPLALCVFLRNDKIFVAKGYDSHEDMIFYRPIGGRIDFGERGHEAVIREVREEIKVEITDLTYLGALENIFEYQGQTGHEIALIYDGRFVDERYNDDDIRMKGEDKGEILYEGSWMRLDSFRGEAAPPLYPAGLLKLLDKADSV